jgi:hypothetical protein
MLWQSDSSGEVEKPPGMVEEEYIPVKFVRQDIVELVVGRGNVGTAMLCEFFVSCADGSCGLVFDAEFCLWEEAPLDG